MAKIYSGGKRMGKIIFSSFFFLVGIKGSNLSENKLQYLREGNKCFLLYAKFIYWRKKKETNIKSNKRLDGSHSI